MSYHIDRKTLNHLQNSYAAPLDETRYQYYRRKYLTVKNIFFMIFILLFGTSGVVIRYLINENESLSVDNQILEYHNKLVRNNNELIRENNLDMFYELSLYKHRLQQANVDSYEELQCRESMGGFDHSRFREDTKGLIDILDKCSLTD